MSVFTRFADIINANINTILDQAEDPEKMVVLIAREMEETLVEIRSTSAKHIAEKKLIRNRIEWLSNESKAWEQKAAFAVQKGRDDLAKAALRERNLVTTAATRLEDEISQIDVNLTKLQTDTERLQEKLTEAKVRQEALLMRGETATSRLKVKRQLHSADIDSALDRFDQYERKLDDLEGQVESYDLGQQTLTAEIAQLGEEDSMEQELSELKRRMAG
jgi:phage shock protein A